MDNNINGSANAPSLLTVSPSPHMKSAVGTRSIMADVLIALLPAYVWGVYTSGLRAILIGVICVASSIGFEALTELILRRPITVFDGSAAVTGLLLAMCLSVAVPLWMPVVGAFFAIVVVKQIFGGIGKNIVNPALAARVFLFSWAGQMTVFAAPGERINSFAFSLDGLDAVSGATPLAALKNGVFPESSVMDSFIGNIGGCIGETSAILLLIGGVYLISRRVITWHIPVSYIATVAILSLVFPQSGDAVEFMLYEITSGGLILGAVFMATDYVTSPITAKGRLIYGVGCGALTVLIRYFGGYPEGVSFAILIMNLLTHYIDSISLPVKFGGYADKKKAEK